MDTKDLNGPAPEEQSGMNESNTGDTKKASEQEHKMNFAGNTGEEPEGGTSREKTGTGTSEESVEGTESAKEPDETSEPAGEVKPPSDSEPAEDDEPVREEESLNEAEPAKEPAEEPAEGAESPKEPAGEAEPAKETAGEPAKEDESAKEPAEDPAEGAETAEEPAGETAASAEPAKPQGPPDFQDMEKEQLLTVLEELIASKPVMAIRNDVEAIKVNFYKRHKADIDQKRKKFMQEGGDAESFDPGEDPSENRFKELYRNYRHSKAAHNRGLEHTKQENLEKKLQVIEDLKELVNSTEDLNRTFPEFRKLQKRWHETGMVPQQKLKDLWDTYHHYVELFYDQIKINKELRDLDLKKNLETKIELCEKAEELLLESNVINAFRQLQKLHDQWRETGPVPRDQKDSIWERFREATHQINKKHQEHFDKLKEAHKKNLETKTALCEKAEAMVEQPLENFKQTEKLTREMIALQRTWKTIGFAPKKDNARIYQRFRNACDKFFAAKREFTAQNKEVLNENLQKKLDLCVQAEALSESTDWKRTTDELITMQKQWKEIGPVPRKHYDPVWKRFRAACDRFFDRKSEFYSNIDSKYEDNLKKKTALIEKIENFKSGENIEDSLRKLKDYQREWVSIGFVPIKEKDKVQKRYRAALDKHFESLKIDDHSKNVVKFRHKLESVKQKPNAMNKLKFEREKFLNKFRQLENDITLWENNIGFFAKSKTADATIKEFRQKIEQGKKQMEVLEEKIRMIDELDN